MAAAAAVLTGARSFAAIAEWAADTPQPIRAALGARHDPLAGGFLVPTETTIRRTLGRLDAHALAPQWATGWPHATATTTPPPRSGHGSGRWPSTARRCAAPTHPTATAAPSTCWRRWSTPAASCWQPAGCLLSQPVTPACPGPGDRRALEAGFAACLPGAAWMTPE
jgi:DDE_Tnp_1-associated